jgi:hypothetical protein
LEGRSSRVSKFEAPSDHPVRNNASRLVISEAQVLYLPAAEFDSAGFEIQRAHIAGELL